MIIVILFLYSNEAIAGAWLKKAGESELITQLERKTLLNYYTNPATKQSALSKAFVLEMYSLYYQYGLTDKFTLILEEKWFNYKNYYRLYEEDTESYQFYAQTELMDHDHYKRFENNPYSTKMLLQTAIWSNDRSVISIQSGFEKYNGNIDQAVEINLLYGYSFNRGYINIEAGRSENIKRKNYDLRRSDKLEVTLAVDLIAKYTTILQLFSKSNIGIFRDQDSVLGQAALLYKYNENIAWQTGYSTNLTRRKQYITESIITGVIIKF